jgi:primosomal protein N' (replication factor Y)
VCHAYALVAVNVPAKNLIRKFLYIVPPELPQLAPGWRVVVPFGHQEVEGFVIATDQSSPKMAAYIREKIEPQVAAGKLQLKPVHVTIGTEPWFDSEMLATAQWLSPILYVYPGGSHAPVYPRQGEHAPGAREKRRQGGGV